METKTPDTLERTLYLTSTSKCSVTVDGPSLLVAAAGRAAQRFPFRLLRAIVVQGSVRLPSELLEQCLQQSIPVSWIGSSGEALGHLWAVREAPRTLSERLDVFWERTDWHWKYENWRRAEERRAIRGMLDAHPVAFDDLRPEEVRRRWLRLLEAGKGWQQLPFRMRLLRGALSALVQEEFVRAGATAESLGRRTAVAQVPEDFTELQMWWLLAALAGASAERKPLAMEGLRRQCVTFVEERRPQLEQRCRRTLDRFDWFLGGLR